MEDKNCLFCKIIKQEVPSSKVYEDDAIYAFNDIAPKAPTHVLVVPKTHIARLSDVNEKNSDWMGKLTLVANKIAAERKIASAGYRIVVNCNAGAGQTVFHLHFHLLGGRSMQWPPG